MSARGRIIGLGGRPIRRAISLGSGDIDLSVLVELATPEDVAALASGPKTVHMEGAAPDVSAFNALMGATGEGQDLYVRHCGAYVKVGIVTEIRIEHDYIDTSSLRGDAMRFPGIRRVRGEFNGLIS